MKITQKICREVKIFNPSNYADGNPYMYYLPQEKWTLSGWRIIQEGKSFSKAWNDYGAMPFITYGRANKQEMFEKAIQWMRDMFGYVEIVKTPMGSWMEKSFVEKRNKEIEEKYKSLKQSTGA